MKRFIVMLFIVVQISSAQYYFGKNKVQYKNFHFKELTTDHFRILFYQGGDNLANFAAQILEETYSIYTKDFGREINFLIPVIIYNSSGDFSQTNVVLELIDEGVGGFTEIFKNRIVVPFTGSYYDFIHVLRHELVHVFQFQIFKNVFSDIVSFAPYEPPLWITEGLAEYCSSHGEFDYYPFMEDLLINDNLIKLDELSNIYGYIDYKEGESVFLFIEEKYGRKKVFEFINALRYRKSVKGAVKAVFGVDFKEFEESWLDFLKLKFWKNIEKKPFYSQNVEVLFKHGKMEGVYNYSPVVSPDGSKIAFVTDKEGYTDVYVISSYDGSLIKKLVRGEQDKKYENIPILRKLLAWIDDETMVIIVHRDGRDMLYIISYPDGKVLKKYKPDVDMIKDVYSYNNRVGFTGVKDGRSDIYILDYSQKDGRVKRLTFDQYEDKEPVFIGRDSFLFISDRADTWIPGNYSIMLGVIKDNYAEISSVVNNVGKIHSLTFDKENRTIWVVRGNERILSGYSINGVYLGDISLPGGIYTVDFANKKNFIVFSNFFDFGWNISLIEDPISKMSNVIVEQENFYPVKKGEEFEAGKYRLSFSLDYLYGGFAYNSVYGMSGGLNLAVSDLLGNHRFYLFSDLSSDIETSNIYFLYQYLEKRMDFGLGLYQKTDYYYVGGDTILEQRLRGGGPGFSYPFSKFMRFEFNPFIFSVRDVYFSYTDFSIYDYQTYFISYMDFAMVGDNTLYYMYSPYTGHRWRTEFYFPVPTSFYTGILDFRQYFRFFYPRYSFAWRSIAAGSYGEDVEKFYIGGLYGVRGIEDDSLVIGNYVAYANLEFRFPFVEEIKFGIPGFSLYGIRGALFMDAGLAQDDVTQGIETDRFLLSAGGSIRWFIFYFPISVDFAYPLMGQEDKQWKIYISLYPEF